MWVFYSFIFLLFAGVLLGSVLRLARHSSDAALSGLSSFLPPLTLFCCLIILIFAPFSTPPPSVVTRSIHYAGIMLLLVFLLFGALCQILVWTKIHRNESLASVAKTYEFWWIATKVAPAPAALCILTSGVRLVYESPANGFLQLPWLFWLIVSFSFFF